MNKLSQHKFFSGIVLSLIILAAFAVRIYNFQDWQYFKMDQGRDAQLVSHAINEGPSMLPLLGPRAGATAVDNGFLRLGPAYYYFQYLSGVVFNSTDPQVFAYPDLFFSLMAIILLYFFARLYFSTNTSLLIATMYAFSFIIIEYSRFAWNPNSLQFFVLVTFFGLLKFLNSEKSKAKLGWLAIWALALAIGSQLHFFGFFVLLGTSGLFILLRSEFWKKEKQAELLSAKFFKQIAIYALVFMTVFSFVYSPVIISDVMKHGENSQNFIQALSSKPTNKPFVDKIVKDFTENTKYYCLISTSYCNIGGVGESLIPAIFTLSLLITGIALAIRAIRKEQARARKDFLLILFIWMAVFFILTIPVSFQLRPRFFILVFALPFLMTGIIFDFLQEKWPKKSLGLVAIIFAIILGLNLSGLLAWFSEQRDSQTKDVKIERTLILKNKDGVTRGELQQAVDFMYAQRKGNNTLYYYVKPEHLQPIKYLLSQKKDSTLKFATLGSTPNTDPSAQFFAIIPVHTDLFSLEERLGGKYTEISEKNAGQIAVYEINFLDRVTSKDFRINKKYEPTDRLFWKDVFGIKKDVDGEGLDEVDMNE
jgi:4-amino-4-deoxy-L-arabinose transferase-like glycosyltransferase